MSTVTTCLEQRNIVNEVYIYFQMSIRIILLYYCYCTIYRVISILANITFIIIIIIQSATSKWKTRIQHDTKQTKN